MIIHSANFLCSNTDHHKCPPAKKPEYAFIGRSNVGKSSLINMLLARKGLAKTSAKPGKTQLINHFEVNESFYIVDLPGYGWASVGKEKKAGFSQMNSLYLKERMNLQCVFVLIDSRLSPQPIDLDFLRWIGTNQVPFALVFTKIDKQSTSRTDQNITVFKDLLMREWEELPVSFLTSAEKGIGRDELLQYIDTLNKNYKH